VEFHRIIKEQLARIVEHDGRACLVLFEDDDKVRHFETYLKSEEGQQFGRIQVLDATITDTAKTDRIRETATAGTIILATRSFGRGSDFLCLDPVLRERGGLHVIQTFHSLPYPRRFKSKDALDGKMMMDLMKKSCSKQSRA